MLINLNFFFLNYAVLLTHFGGISNKIAQFWKWHFFSIKSKKWLFFVQPKGPLALASFMPLWVKNRNARHMYISAPFAAALCVCLWVWFWGLFTSCYGGGQAGKRTRKRVECASSESGLLAKAANAKSSKSKRQKVNTSLDCFAILFHNKIISSSRSLSLSLPLSFCVLSLAAKYRSCMWVCVCSTTQFKRARGDGQILFSKWRGKFNCVTRARPRAQSN